MTLTPEPNPGTPVNFVLTDAGREALAAHRATVATRYTITADDGWTELWCRDCTGGGDDYLAEWEGDPEQHAAAILAARIEHERKRH